MKMVEFRRENGTSLAINPSQVAAVYVERCADQPMVEIATVEDNYLVDCTFDEAVQKINEALAEPRPNVGYSAEWDHSADESIPYQVLNSDDGPEDDQ
jgi:hypothetical protein